MRQRAIWSAVLVVGLALAGCGSASDSGKSTSSDGKLFNGGGQIRDRVDALVPLDDYVAEDKQRLAGWDAFSKDGKIYAAPVTLQGHPIYYNKTLYEKA